MAVLLFYHTGEVRGQGKKSSSESWSLGDLRGTGTLLSCSTPPFKVLCPICGSSPLTQPRFGGSTRLGRQEQVLTRGSPAP